jgi:hypothetical protein
MSPLRWMCKSLRRLAAELKKIGHEISDMCGATCVDAPILATGFLTLRCQFGRVRSCVRPSLAAHYRGP